MTTGTYHREDYHILRGAGQAKHRDEEACSQCHEPRGCTHVVGFVELISSQLLSQCSMVLRFGNITTMKWWDNLYLNEGGY